MRKLIVIAFVAALLAATAVPALTAPNADRWPGFSRTSVGAYCLAKPGTTISLIDGTVRINVHMVAGGKPLGKEWLFTPYSRSNTQQQWGLCPTR